MLTKLSERFYAISKIWYILLLLGIFIAVLVATLPALQDASAGIEGLDTRYFYTPEEAYRTISSYSTTGREMLRSLYLSVDVAYPLLYSTLLTLLVSWVLKQSTHPESRWRRLNILPLGAIFFDLLENISIVAMLTAFPNQLRIVAQLALIGTMGKYFLLSVSVGLITVGLVKALLNRILRTYRVDTVTR